MILRLPGGSTDFWGPTTNYSAEHEGIDNPTEDDIRLAFDALQKGWIEFAILEDDSGRFVQTAGSGDGPYVLDYNEGSTQWQFRASDSNITKARALNAFLGFRRGDPAWNSFHVAKDQTLATCMMTRCVISFQWMTASGLGALGGAARTSTRG